MSIIDYASLPEPSVKEALDYETELADKKALLQERFESWDADVESDPALKLLEVSAYDAVIERQRVNDAAVAVMLPWATGDDLDNLAAIFNKTRNTITDDDGEETEESDSAFKERILGSWAELTNAGTPDSYTAHAKNADEGVKDAKAECAGGGLVTTYLLSYDDNGTASDTLIATVQDYLDSDDIRQLCSTNTVTSAAIEEYSITAELEIADTAIESTVLAEAEENVQAYVDSVHYLESMVSESALYAALHLEGVLNVQLGNSSLDDAFTTIETDASTAPYCTSITITAKEQA